MSSLQIVIAQRNPTTARELADKLTIHFTHVGLASSAQELIQIMRHHQPKVVVVGLELFALDEITALSRIFSGLTIVCTHHAPDEHMWMAAIRAGATEFCHPQDFAVILHAAQHAPHTHPKWPVAA
jgi:DNA-binding NarL/FixJ family response regulator